MKETIFFVIQFNNYCCMVELKFLPIEPHTIGLGVHGIYVNLFIVKVKTQWNYIITYKCSFWIDLAPQIEEDTPN